MYKFWQQFAYSEYHVILIAMRFSDLVRQTYFAITTYPNDKTVGVYTVKILYLSIKSTHLGWSQTKWFVLFCALIHLKSSH